MDFVALDFETANYQRDSVCEIGLAYVRGGRLVGTEGWRVRPEPNYFCMQNIRVHGICAADVRHAPTFAELWPSLRKHFEHTCVVAHNASFDISVLRYALQGCDEVFPDFQYACSLQIARRMWRHLPSHGLAALAAHFGIDLQHHAAEADARASALLMLEAARSANLPANATAHELAQCLGLQLGTVFPGGYTPAGVRKRPRPPRQATT